MSAVPRVVLAGGRASPELAKKIDNEIRALALFRGKPLLDYVVEALIQSDPAAPIAVVGDVPDSPNYLRVPDKGDFVSNIMAGVGEFKSEDWVLIASADMPYLTGGIVCSFIASALELGSAAGPDLVYPIVRVSACYAQFPGLKRTAIKLREGEFTGGNMVLVRPAFILQRSEVIADTYASRKQPFRLAAMLGLPTIARLAISQIAFPGALSIEMLEQRVGALVKGRVAALVSDDPEIATDLDRPSDFEAASAGVISEKPRAV